MIYGAKGTTLRGVIVSDGIPPVKLFRLPITSRRGKIIDRMNRWSIKPKNVFILLGIIFLVYMMMDFNSRLENSFRLNKQAATVRAQATEVILTQTALYTQAAEAGSTQAVEDWARRSANYIQPGDHPVKPLPQPGSTPIVPAAAIPFPTPIKNWEVWWELFFGG